MRIVYLALVVMLAMGWATGFAPAFEIEENRSYPAVNQRSQLRIISTADINVFEPFIHRFQEIHPTVSIDYSVASSTELMRGVYVEQAPFDLAISSAMDLQTKIANDGLAQTYISAVTMALPQWAKWQNKIYAFTQEPAVLVISEADFEHTDIPVNREQLIGLLRNYPDQFDDRIGTYDIRSSGLGYLFATQDSRNTEAFWRLTEVMGRLKAKLYCCSGQMIADVASGKLALAYNVLGSYARSQLASTPGIRVVELDDFVSVMLRTALIPAKARNAKDAGLMIDFLVKPGGRLHNPNSGLPALLTSKNDDADRVRPIRLGPGLLVFLDQLRRKSFLRSWTSAILQEGRT